MKNSPKQQARPIIGVLAGMGPSSTAPFVDMLVAACRRQYGARDDIDFPKMMICSQPAPFFHDREFDHAALEAATIDGLRSLESGGASFIAIACNSVHMYFSRLQHAVSVPVLNIVDLAFDSLPVEAKRVAILASRPLAEAGLYQTEALRRGYDVVDADVQGHIDALQERVKEGADPAAFSVLWSHVFEAVRNANADTVLIACFDLSGTIKHVAPGVMVVDAAVALAEGTVRAWRTWQHESSVDADGAPFQITTDKSRIDPKVVHRFLSKSYWASGIALAQVQQSIDNSLCFGVYGATRELVGFARVVTDHVTMAYLCDVFVLPEFRQRGFGGKLIDTVMRHKTLRQVRRVLLATRDAHALYRKRGFNELGDPALFMEVFRPEAYIGQAPSDVSP